MTRKKIKQQLKKIFLEILKLRIDRELDADETASWDSLSHIKLIMNLEIIYGIRVLPEEISELYSTFNHIMDYLCKKLGINK